MNFRSCFLLLIHVSILLHAFPEEIDFHIPTLQSKRRLHHDVKHHSTYVPFRLDSLSLTTSSSKLTPNDATLSSDEKEVLVDLFLLTNGANWLRNKGWVDILNATSMTTLHPCGRPSSDGSDVWYGLTCVTAGVSSSKYHISSIDLHENRLVGGLPPRLFNALPYLESIDMSNRGSGLKLISNSLFGEIPTLCDSKNTSLAYVLLEYNHLSGIIDDCIGNLTELSVLQLDFNPITGTLPTTIASLKKLEELHLRGTRLSGSIPNDIGKCTSLQVLDMSNLNADGSYPGSLFMTGSLPHSLCDLHHLTKLEFQHTYHLYGSIPECFGSNQQSIVTLTLQDNLLTGSIPESFCSIGNELNLLFLYNNSLSGSIPNCFGDFLTGLSDIELFQNGLTGTLPNSLCNIISMEYLYIYTASLTGTIPSCFNKNVNLMEILLDGNRLTGNFLPEEWCELGDMMHSLDLYDNLLTGTIPSCISNFTQLTRFEIAWNQISGTLPRELCEIGENLELFAAFKMKLVGSIPDCFAYSFPKLETFFLQDNSLHGKLPQHWNLPSLISIVLSNNYRLRGKLPYSLFTQQNQSTALSLSSYSDLQSHYSTTTTTTTTIINSVLQSIVIEGTRIHGSIPNSLCSAVNLVTFAFSGNQLTGSLPPCFVNLQELQVLRIASNQISGSLPVSLANLTSLTELDMSRNLMNGKLQSELGTLSPQLRSTKLSLNRLSCDIPSSIRHWTIASDNFRNLDILDGNLFGCGSHNLLSLVIAQAPGLKNANEDAFQSYTCGASEYVPSVLVICLLVLPLLMVLIYKSYSSNNNKSCFVKSSNHGGVSNQNLVSKDHLKYKVYFPSPLTFSFENAENSDIKKVAIEFYNFAVSFIGIAVVSIGLIIPLLLFVASSPFSCTYGSEFTIGFKEGKDEVLSGGIGLSASLVLFIGLLPWWRKRKLLCESAETKNSQDLMISSPLSLSSHKNSGAQLMSDSHDNEDDDVIDDDLIDVSKHIPRRDMNSGIANNNRLESAKCMKKIKVFTQLFLQTVFIAIASIGPNAVYVLVLLNKSLPNVYKQLSTAAITLFKVMLQNVLIPYVARITVDLLFSLPLFQYMLSLNSALDDRVSLLKYNFRLNISIILACLTTIIAPIAVVSLTDDRCLYNVLYPEVEETNQVVVPYCYVKDAEGRCSTFAYETVQSSYKPIFNYSGERCVSAVLDIYAPVFVASVLLAALLPATLELIIVPLLVHRLFHVSSNVAPSSVFKNKLAKYCLLLLRSSAWNVNSVLYLSHDISLKEASMTATNASRRVIERGFSQLLATLAIALTFGIFAPFVGMSCCLAALILIGHHWSIFIQIVKTHERNVAKPSQLLTNPPLHGRNNSTATTADKQHHAVSSHSIDTPTSIDIEEVIGSDDDDNSHESRVDNVDSDSGGESEIVSEHRQLSMLTVDLARCNSVPFSCALVVILINISMLSFVCFEYLNMAAGVLTMSISFSSFIFIFLIFQSNLSDKLLRYLFNEEERPSTRAGELTLSESLLLHEQ